MKRKKGLVIDSQRYFGRFLKYEFKEDFAFDSYINIEKFENEIEDYNFMFFMVYTENELKDLIKLYKKDIPLIVSSFNEKIKAKLEKIQDIVFLDSGKIKAEMRIDLKLCFDSIL